MSLGSTSGGSLMDYDNPSAASQVNVPWMWPSWGWGLHKWASLCKEGWVFSASDQRFHHAQETSSLPLSWGEVCVNLISEGCDLSHSKLRQRWFSAEFGFLVDVFLSPSLVCFSPDLRWLNNSVPFILFRQFNSQSKVPVRHLSGRGGLL